MVRLIEENLKISKFRPPSYEFGEKIYIRYLTFDTYINVSLNRTTKM